MDRTKRALQMVVRVVGGEKPSYVTLQVPTNTVLGPYLLPSAVWDTKSTMMVYPGTSYMHQ